MPTLFISMNKSILCYETCVLAKSHRATYSIINFNKSAIHFELIYYDVWGPSREPIVLDMRYFCVIY